MAMATPESSNNPLSPELLTISHPPGRNLQPFCIKLVEMHENRHSGRVADVRFHPEHQMLGHGMVDWTDLVYSSLERNSLVALFFHLCGERCYVKPPFSLSCLIGSIRLATSSLLSQSRHRHLNPASCGPSRHYCPASSPTATQLHSKTMHNIIHPVKTWHIFTRRCAWALWVELIYEVYRGKFKSEFPAKFGNSLGG